MMIAAKILLIAALASGAFVATAASQTPRKKLDPTSLTCGQKVRVDDQTCPTGQILEVAGSCIHETPADGTRAKGVQYNCVKRQ